jgi:serine/threonine protein kinase/tetratricopeptide (TPR) repeat protein
MTDILINNRYRLLRELGTGSMSTVYLAADLLQGERPVALKMLKREMTTSFTLDNFKSEFDVMTRLKHPNLACVYDFEQTVNGTSHFITMEYVDGTSLKGLAKGIAGLPREKIIDIIIAFSRALDFIHSRDVLHRDIKPSNIMLTGYGESHQAVKVIDFGLADWRFIDRENLKGTFYYLAPEILRGVKRKRDLFDLSDEQLETTLTFVKPENRIPARQKAASDDRDDDELGDTLTFMKPHRISPEHLDRRIDIYAAGITFLELITGTGFYNGESPESILIKSNDESAFREKLEGVLGGVDDPVLREILYRMTAYKPEERYSHMAEIISDFNRAGKTSISVETPETRMAYLLGADFIGRERELSRLRESVTDPGSRGKLLLVEGAIGMGKSRLFREFRKVCQINDYLFFQGDCRRRIAVTYGPFRDILGEALTGATVDQIDRFGPELKKLLPHHTRLAALKTPDLIEPELERRLLTKAAIEFLIELSRTSERRINVFIDDLQWADEGTLDFLREFLFALARSPAGKNIRFYASVRSEETQAIAHYLEQLERRKQLIRTMLSSFGVRELRMFIRSIFGRDYIDDSLGDSIHLLKEKVGGNPFFLQELMKKLVDGEYIVRRELKWSLDKDLATIEMPMNLREIVSSRIGDLNIQPDEMKCLELLALLNRSITIEEFHDLIAPKSVVSEEIEIPLLFEPPCPDVKLLFHRLTKGEILLTAEVKGKITFRFAHELLREAIRDRVEDREIMHRYLGYQLERIYRTNLDEYFEDLAHHFSGGREKKKALFYLEKAADNAMRNYSNEKALHLFHDILDAGKYSIPLHKRIDTHLKQAKIYSHIGEWAHGEQSCEQAIILSEDKGDVTSLARSYRTLGELYYLKNDYQKAEDIFTKAHAMHEKGVEEKGLSETVRYLGTIAWRRGNFEKAIKLALKSLQMYRDIDNARGVANSLKLLADISSHMQRYDESMKRYRESLEIYRKIHDRQGAASVLNNIGVVLLDRGDFDTALSHYQQALNVYEQLGNKQGISIANCNIGEILRCKGKYEKAITFLDRAIAIGNELEINYHHGSYLIDKARLLFLLERYDAARPLVREGLKKVEKVGRKEYIFLGKVITEKIRYASGGVGGDDERNEAVESLKNMLETSRSDEEKAFLHFELFGMTGEEHHRRESRRLYQGLHGKTQKYEYLQKLNALSE